MEKLKKTSQHNPTEQGPSESVQSNQPTESTTVRSSEKQEISFTPKSYHHGGQNFGGQSIGGHGDRDSLGARRRSSEQTSVTHSDSGVKRRSEDGPKAAEKMLGGALSGLLAGVSSSVDFGPYPSVPTPSPEKKKVKSSPKPKDFFDALVCRDKTFNFRNLNEGQIKGFLEKFQIEHESEDSFCDLQEKLFHHAREEIKRRVGADPDKYRVVLIQNNLPKAPKPSKPKKMEDVTNLASGDPPDPGQMSTCDICNFEQKSNNQKVKKLSQDETDAAKFIHKEGEVQFLCQDHYKTTFKSINFKGLNKKCSNPFGLPQHSSKNRLASLDIATVADIKR